MVPDDSGVTAGSGSVSPGWGGSLWLLESTGECWSTTGAGAGEPS